MNISQRFATNLIRLREEAGLTSDELARRAAIGRARIDSFEGGELLPRVEDVAKLAGALEVSVPALTEGIAWRPGKDGTGEFEVAGE